MLKKLGLILVLTLALNFLAAAGGVGFLWSQGKLGQDQILAIKEVLYPVPEEPAPAVEAPEVEPERTPILKLEALLDEASGGSVDETVRHIRAAFDSRMVVLDRRRREVADLHRQVELARARADAERSSLAGLQAQLEARQQVEVERVVDEGFQESLALYGRMQAKQVKAIFTELEEDVVVRYLTSMEPRQAAKVIKEFKTPAETAYIQRVLEKIRLAETKVTTASSVASVAGGD